MSYDIEKGVRVRSGGSYSWRPWDSVRRIRVKNLTGGPAIETVRCTMEIRKSNPADVFSFSSGGLGHVSTLRDHGRTLVVDFSPGRESVDYLVS
jgi:hypothetical protein